MDESSLGIHEIEFVINSWEDFSNCSWVWDHAACSHNLGEVTSWNHSWWLIVDSAFESSWAPVDELDSSLGLNGCNSGVNIFWYDISSIHETASHVFTVSWIALSHHRSWLESWVGDLSNWELFMICFFSWDDWWVWWKHKVDSWIWDQVGLELSNINVKSTIESERSSQWWDNLSNKSIQVSVGWSFNIEISSADIIDGFVIKHNGNISVLKKGVSRKNWVVWLNDCSWNLWGWVDSETEFWFLTVIDWESLEKERSKSRSSTSSYSVEDKESLETCALICKLSDSIKAEINDFFTDSVVSSGEVVGGIFFTWDELLRMEKLSVCSGSNFINNSWFKIKEDTSWDVFTSSSFWEESVEGIISSSNGFVWWHLTVWLDSVLKTEELPTGVTDLDTALTNMNWNNFSHLKSVCLSCKNKNKL